jgi:hypothetical protein
MARRSVIAPYRQGELDGLCGIYALINAIRLATYDRTSEFGHDVWRELLLILLSEAEGLVGTTATVVVHGIGAKPLYALAKLAARHMAVNHGAALRVARGLGVTKRSFHAVVSCLGELSERPSVGIVIELSGYSRHWTVIRRVGKRSLEFLDSSSLHRAQLAKCRLKDEWAHNVGREHVIHPRRVLLIYGHGVL